MNGRHRRTIIGTPLAPLTRALLGLLGVAMVVALYGYFARQKHAEGMDWLGPGLRQFGEALHDVTTRNKRTDTVWIVEDTRASLTILCAGMGAGVALSVVLGVAMGIFSTVEAVLSPVVIALAKVPPVALLPIFMSLFGVGDAAKIALILVGISPTLANGVVLTAKAVPRNTIVKAYTLGASTPEVVVKVILPTILPQILDALRLSIGPAWVYLVASEALAADAGLGYRIFLVQRQYRMDIIILYCAWLGVLGTAMDYALVGLSRLVCPWAAARKDD